MPDEIEAKVRVDDLAAVRSRLLAAGAARVGRVREVNTYYALPDADCGLRTRLETDERGQTRGRVTFKGPRQAGPYKRREEIEFDASDTAAAGLLLERLGHAPSLLFEKRRETFTLDGCEVVLDELPELGTFVEVEGPDDAAVAAVLKRLELDGHKPLHDGYASMIAATGKRELRFGDARS